ncbi:MAG: DUF1152 domain-containing protein [Archaeoglobaceae archaeon]|nr:DUF1152 domain-containing protein [Archaeoglobaceae archaeon]MDW7989048.1 DUF1152 domain-containing protein [Archaeoglobaceae archaeon]
MEFIRILKSCKKKKALVFGIGGGGDIVSTIPVSNFLRQFDFEILNGGVIWDRLVVDPKPGPRSLEELLNIERVAETLAFIEEDTITSDKIKPNLARATKFFGKVLGLDITKGVKKLCEDLKNFSEERGIDLFIGVDAGGDAISFGYESGVRSPLADAISVALLNQLNGIVAVSGFGSDGELKFEEILLNISELYKNNGFIGCSSMSEDDCIQMEKVCEEVVTEASRIPILAFRGELGIKKIRKGRTVLITPLSTLIFYFKAKAVLEINECAKLVLEAKSIEEANRILNKNGIITELDYERVLSV